ncbi:MAG: alpha/beta hydrolase [Candidatus Omnitrophica bacterium]|nr:alpha/beta hydrolase [Candidatus Omnitrophota bacterium]
MIKWLTNLIVTSLLFFPEEDFYALPRDFGLASEDAVMTTRDGVQLHGWFLPAGNSGTYLVFFHGNAGNISGRLGKAKGWVERGVSVLLMDYRGYGKSRGDIEHENDLYVDAETAVQWLKEKKGAGESAILLYGESLGSAPATELATRQAYKGLILEAPFASVPEMAKLHYPWAPISLARDFQFDNLNKIAKVRCPVFIIHGTTDETCPYAMGCQLFERAPEPKELLSLQNGRHNDLDVTGGKDYFDRPYNFFKRATGPAPSPEG